MRKLAEMEVRVQQNALLRVSPMAILLFAAMAYVGEEALRQVWTGNSLLFDDPTVRDSGYGKRSVAQQLSEDVPGNELCIECHEAQATVFVGGIPTYCVDCYRKLFND